jgi:hypothetical protein
MTDQNETEYTLFNCNTHFGCLWNSELYFCMTCMTSSRNTTLTQIQNSYHITVDAAVTIVLIIVVIIIITHVTCITFL